MTKLASKVDGGDAENKFSGSDQSLDALIAAMEEAQVCHAAACFLGELLLPLPPHSRAFFVLK